MIKFHTNFGVIAIELDHEKAPVTAANFEQYVKDGFYDGVIFHRVIKGFMIQGGGMDADMNEKATRATIENEAANGLTNDKYTIAMARTSAPHSASAQFFINTANNSFLNFKAPNPQGFGYAVFGKVVEGFDVVDQIELVKTGNKGYHQDVPKEAVVITKAEIV
ncbi:peptidylprolyl isomerase [Vitreoscilla stercoraria]|uniref:Peptidyl-prolyl cis-trans isomerase n=1 Tax=Vitreoscilla stercoraria TaxID=61 RepID=A0ABY4ECN3_VITST|nr:peptidylprolyl isomerase [Vitreoscilla stercoraria]UOO93051.1 peptidylprolyl isomerase [Vitreoscilla stercoraria]